MTYKRTHRQTIKGALSFTSTGVHSGTPSTMNLYPSSKKGVIFKRIDIKNCPTITVQYDTVIDTKLCTKIANETGDCVATIEHIMSALFACSIDDVEIHLNNEEIPIMDGSSLDFTKRLLAIGVSENKEKLQYIKVLKEISIKDGDGFIRLLPHDGFSVDASIDFNRGGIGTQQMTFDFNTDSYENLIAPARTFGFKSDVDALRKMGLALGGSIHNAVVYDDTGTQQALRMENEAIAHKILDIIGDLSLSGKPLLCHVVASRMGHRMNNAILHELFSNDSNFTIT